MIQKVEIESATILESDHGITVLNIKPGREITQTDVQELFIECNKFTKLTGPLLIIVPADVSVSFPALKEAARDDGATNIAFVTEKQSTYMLSSTVFSILNKLGSARNMRAFRSRSEAELWLMDL